MTRERWKAATLPLSLLGGGLLVAVLFVVTKPEPARTPAPEMVEIVRAETVHRKRRPVRIVGHGSVRPAREVRMTPEVSGKIVAVHDDFVPGSVIAKDEVLARIDPEDYRLAVRQRSADVTSAEVELRLEEGRRRVAEREWELLGEESDGANADPALALRKPQLESAEAALAAAKSRLAQARLDLERTSVRMPFDGVVVEKLVDAGQSVGPQTVLARVVGADRAWVHVKVPVDRLEWIDVPTRDGKGSVATVVQETTVGASIARGGQVLRIVQELESEGRLATVLVEVADPFGIVPGSGIDVPLLMGSYVRVEIAGRHVENVFEIPRHALREGDRVWVANDDDRLEIHDVQVAWKGESHALVRSGLDDGSRVVVSRIGSPVPGVRLRVSNEENP